MRYMQRIPKSSNPVIADWPSGHKNRSPCGNMSRRKSCINFMPQVVSNIKIFANSANKKPYLIYIVAIFNFQMIWKSQIMLIAILLTFQAMLVSFTQMMKTSKREKITETDADWCKSMTMPHMDHFELKIRRKKNIIDSFFVD